ncbi:hypothetical protein TNCV_937351 [Trichonephila clavipes]|nr:hypothetical protein TNCV_937351 [Trichonephila clavipes]
MLGFVLDKYNVLKTSTSITPCRYQHCASVTKPFFEENHASPANHQQQIKGPLFPSFINGFTKQLPPYRGSVMLSLLPRKNQACTLRTFCGKGRFMIPQNIHDHQFSLPCIA